MLQQVALLLVATLLLSSTNRCHASSSSIEVDCDPCIEREAYKIKAIVHGRDNSDFWQQVQTAARQAGKDMRVDLDFPLYGSDIVRPEDNMVQDIAAAASLAASGHPDAPKALIVTIPSEAVKEAIMKAAKDIAIFGMNSGYREAEEADVLAFVGMDEYLGGRHAGDAFLAKKNVTRALYVNHEAGNSALQQRYEGFASAILASNPAAEVIDRVLDGSTEALEALYTSLEGCPFDSILIGGYDSFDIIVEALDRKGCSYDNHLLGGFDTHDAVFEAIVTGKLSFAISQQQYLQGTFSVVMAAFYVTTGKALAKPNDSEYGVYLSGPKLFDRSNLPTDSQQKCEAQAFPVCDRFDNSTIASSQGDSCPCLDRSKIRIGGVLHGVTTDAFWNDVFPQAFQAADDLGVELLLDRLEPQPNKEVWHLKMSRKMVSLCHEGVDGLFITIPDDDVLDAIRECQALNVPVVSINSGATNAMMLGLPHHISQLEEAAGIAAGEKLVRDGIQVAICLNNEEGHVSIVQRCGGFESIVREQDVEFLEVVANRDSFIATVTAVERAVGRDDDWEGIAFLNSGNDGAEATIELKKRHPKMLVGTFDVKEEVFAALGEGMFEFAIDQGPILQGYYPVWLLTLMATTQQTLLNTFIGSGPQFVTRAPNEAEQECSVKHFEVCPRPLDVIYEDHLLSSGIKWFAYLVVALSWGLSLYFLRWTWIHKSKNIVQASQPEFMALMCVGAMISSSTLLALSVEEGTGESNGASSACTLVPILYSLGWILIFGSLCAKTLRMFKIMKNKNEGKQVVITSKSMIMVVIVALGIDLALVTAWTIANPLVYVRNEIGREEDLFAATLTVESVGSCAPRNSDGPSFWLFVVPLITFHFMLMVATNVLLYCVKDVSDRYQESKYVGFAMVLMLETLVVGLPIAIAVGDVQALFVVAVGVIGVHDISVLSLLFIPKILFQSSEKDEEANRDEDALVLASMTKVSKSKFGEVVDMLDEVVASGKLGLSERQREQLRTVKTLLIQRKDDKKMYLPSQLGGSSKSNAFIMREFGGIASGLLNHSTRSTVDDLLLNLDCSKILPEFQALPDQKTKRKVYELLSWPYLKRWNFPIFELDEMTGGNPLLFMGYAILGAPQSQYAMARECGFDVDREDFGGYDFIGSSLQIPVQQLCDYLRAVEGDYCEENPYHTATHAADVLQTLHSLIQMKSSFFKDKIEVFSILLAAVVHDVKHPGINNAFQINAKTHMALVYNDNSVLENMHCSHAFVLMMGENKGHEEPKKDLNLLCNVRDNDFVSIRSKVLEAVLQTDMSKHFAWMDGIKGRLEDHGDSEESRWDLLMFMLHAADISGQAKGGTLFLKWAELCFDEFFAQGDAEKRLGLPVSPLCDRKTTNKFESQTGFLTYVVHPTFDVLQLAIPKVREVILPTIQSNMAYWAQQKNSEVSDV